MKETLSVKAPLLKLPDESLLEILMACDPESALRMTQTCKILHLLSDSKLLWMTLLAKLEYDQAPDVGPHVDLDSLQAKEVKRIVARALTSYNNWCCPDGPRATREQKVQLENHQLVALTVLPGCQYLFVQSRNDDYLGVWDINRETLITRYQCNRKVGHITCDCALLKGGKIARVAFLRDEDPDHIEVVDFDLHHGHATLLFSESSPNVWLVSRLKVWDEAVLIRSLYNRVIALLSPETGKIATVKLAIGSYHRDSDIVRGSLICLVTASDGTVRLLVAKLSRIFEQDQGTPLEDICETYQVPTFIQPNPLGHSQYTLNVCDPVGWGSARPCRILVAHISYRISNSENKRVQVHRLYLEGSHNGSDLALTYDSSSNCVPLEKSSDRQLALTQPSIPGRWLLPSRPGKGKYDIMVDRLWEDDVRLSPSEDFFSAIWEEAERFSGTQVWYLEDGDCIFHFFD